VVILCSPRKASGKKEREGKLRRCEGVSGAKRMCLNSFTRKEEKGKRKRHENEQEKRRAKDERLCKKGKGTEFVVERARETGDARHHTFFYSLAPNFDFTSTCAVPLL